MCFLVVDNIIGPTDESYSGSKADSVNFDDPLYFHPSDNYVTTIVTIKLTGTGKTFVFGVALWLEV